MRRWVLAAGLAVGLGLVLSPGAEADECGRTAPSPQTSEATGIVFSNDTQYAFRVLWSDFSGRLVEYGLVQPFEELGIDTYVDHLWMVELFTPDGSECLGPISAPGPDTCRARILYDQGIGIDAGFCDF